MLGVETRTIAVHKRFGISLPLLLALCVYIQLIGKTNDLLSDPDTYWHIGIGRWIIEHKAIPDHDVFSYSIPGAPWIPFAWLADVVFAWLYDHFGWVALTV